MRRLMAYKMGAIAVAGITILGFSTIVGLESYQNELLDRTDDAYRSVRIATDARRSLTRARARHVNYIVTGNPKWADQRDVAMMNVRAEVQALYLFNENEAQRARISFLDSLTKSDMLFPTTVVDNAPDGPTEFVEKIDEVITQIISTNEKMIREWRTTSWHHYLLYGFILFYMVGTYVYFLMRMYKDFSGEVLTVEKMASDQRLLLRELNHRVKNSLQNVASVLRLQLVRLPANEVTAIEALQTASMRIAAVGKVHEMLYELQTSAEVNAKELIQKLVSDFQKTAPVEINTELRRVNLHLDHAVPLALLINELLTNTVKYGTSGKARVEVHIKFGPAPGREDTHWMLCVHDSGPGFPAGFSMEKAKTLGYKLIRGLIQQLDVVEVVVGNDEGARFEIVAPIIPPRQLG